jgi:ABC-type molybdate transport system permease subunit
MAMIAANKVIFSTIPVTTLPLLLTLAEAADDYEYGAVDAPIGIAWAGGILAILTATLPIFLKSGEKAFEEIKDRDADTFGKRNDILKKKK